MNIAWSLDVDDVLGTQRLQVELLPWSGRGMRRRSHLVRNQ